MRTLTYIIIIFIVTLMFFEVLDWTPNVPTTKEVTTEKTIIVETVDETGEVVNSTTTTESITDIQEVTNQDNPDAAPVIL